MMLLKIEDEMDSLYQAVTNRPLIKSFALLFFVVLIICCQKADNQGEFSGIRFIEHPSVHGGQAFLHVSGDDRMFSSWLEYINDSLVEFRYSRFENNRWSPSQVISRGDDWFVNWADFPSLVVNGHWMAAHWLQYRGAGVYDYDVHITQSIDGQNWSSSFIPHSDGVAAEHGFVTLFPLNDQEFFATWLDGRHTRSETTDGNDHEHHHQGAMTLRSAIFDQTGNITGEAELDARVCDCCQTDVALTRYGPLVVYRDRSPDEVRDIFIVRSVRGEWQEPRAVFEDGWQIGGCPVNGPSVVASDDLVAVAWFTMARDSARVKLAFSEDGGASFGEPVIISDRDPAGRVDLVFAGTDKVLVTWLENMTDHGAMIRGRLVAKTGCQSEPFDILSTSPARKSGFPRLARSAGKIFLSWTAIESEEVSRIRTGELLFR